MVAVAAITPAMRGSGSAVCFCRGGGCNYARYARRRFRPKSPRPKVKKCPQNASKSIKTPKNKQKTAKITPKPPKSAVFCSFCIKYAHPPAPTAVVIFYRAQQAQLLVGHFSCSTPKAQGLKSKNAPKPPQNRQKHRKISKTAKITQNRRNQRFFARFA